MALFFNNRFANFRNRNNGQNNNLMFNNVPNNRFMYNRYPMQNQLMQPYMQNGFTQNQPSQPYMQNWFSQNQQPITNGNEIINQDVSLKPLTEEELKKINEEIQENIAKNKNFMENKKDVNIEESFQDKIDKKNKDIVNSYIEQFIQNESNANIFYNHLSNKSDNDLYKTRLKNISDDCILECNSLKSFYKEVNEKDFETKNVNINVNIPFKDGILLAIEEEIKSYDKICKIIEQVPQKETNIFYKMALKKLNRINNIQYMAINNKL